MYCSIFSVSSELCHSSHEKWNGMDVWMLKRFHFLYLLFVVVQGYQPYDICSSNTLQLEAKSSWSLLQSPNFPMNYADNTDCNVDLQSHGKGIEIKIIFFQTESCCDYLQINSGAVRKISGSPGVDSYSYSGDVRLQFHTDQSETKEGFRLMFRTLYGSGKSNYRCSASGVSIRAATIQQSLSSPGFPQQYSNNLNCKYAISVPYRYRVDIVVAHIDTETTDKLTLTSDSARPISLSGSNTRYQVFQFYSTVNIEFSSDNSYARKGFLLFFSAIDPSLTTSTPATSWCTGIFTATSETKYLTSPNYPRSYPRSVTCRYTIRSLNGHPVNIRVLSFTTEERYDILRLNSDGISESWSGSKASGTTFQGRANYDVELLFTTDGGTEEGGFRLAYTTSAANSLSATSSVQYLQSPNFPLINRNEHVNYDIHSSNGWPVTVKAIIFDTSSYGTLEFSSGARTETWRGSIFRGHSFTAASSDELVSLHFQSDSQGTWTALGYMLAYYAVPYGSSPTIPEVNRATYCGSEAVELTATLQPGLLFSSDFPNGYKNSMDCRWKITSDDDSRLVRVERVHFHTEPSLDELLIRSGTHDSAHLLATWSGSYSWGLNVTSRCSSMFLHFTTDYSRTYAGFYLKYYTVSADDEEIASSDCRPKGWLSAVVGGTVGGAILLAIVSIIVCCCCCKRKQSRCSSPSASAQYPTQVFQLPRMANQDLGSEPEFNLAPPSYAQCLADPQRYKMTSPQPAFTNDGYM